MQVAVTLTLPSAWLPGVTMPNARVPPPMTVQLGSTVAVTVNFLSETCNAYRYDRVGAREGSEGVFAFKPERNEPNVNCRFVPQYADPAAQWVLVTQPPPEN